MAKKNVKHQQAGHGTTQRHGPIPRRIIHDTDRLSPTERKKIFARNLDHLIMVIGLKLNEAAEQIGISYRLVRRLVSAGISRPDERNEENLQKIVEFFMLHGAYELWQPDLLSWLLNPDYAGSKFIDHFRDNLTRVREQHLARVQQFDQQLMSLITSALGVESPRSAYWDRFEAILASPKADQFMCLIDDYYELISKKHLKAA